MKPSSRARNSPTAFRRRLRWIGVGVIGLSLAAAVEYYAWPGWSIELAWPGSTTTPFRLDWLHLEHAIAATLAFAVWGYYWQTHSWIDRSGTISASQITVRSLAFIALALTLAQPRMATPHRRESIVLLSDQSASAQPGSAQLGPALRRTLQSQMSEKTASWHVIDYAADARLGRFDAVSRSPYPEWTQSSQHGQALDLASQLAQRDDSLRVVWHSDLRANPSEHQATLDALQRLQENWNDAGRSLELAVVPIPSATQRERIEIVELEMSPELILGQPATIRAQLDVPKSGNYRIELFRDELRWQSLDALNKTTNKPSVDKTKADPVLLASTTHTLSAARQSVELQFPVEQKGPFQLRAVVRPDESSDADNDAHNDDEAHRARIVWARGPATIGMVEGRAQDPLVRALSRGQFHIDRLSPRDVQAQRLASLDLLILVELAANQLNKSQCDAIESFVRGGGGVLVIGGGETGFGLGRWEQSPLASILPVRFSGEKQREQPGIALVLVIDKSGSMSSNDKLDRVKQAAELTAKTLDPNDELGVVAFDSAPEVLVRLQAARHRLRIASAIRRVSAGGGTDALPALREAYLQLVGSDAALKHIILLSDGQSPESGIHALLSDMRNARITVSTVGVGSGAGKSFLDDIARRGRGRYYFSQDGSDVPQIFTRETHELTRNSVQEEQHFVRSTRAAQALRGLDLEHAPPLLGLVPVQAKPRAEPLIETQNGAAVLVRARVGLGRIAAFASDAHGRWAKRWLRWSGYPQLWTQIARDLMRQEKRERGELHIDARPTPRANAWTVTLSYPADLGFAHHSGATQPTTPNLALEVRSLALDELGQPIGTSEILETQLVGPGRYEASIHVQANARSFIYASLNAVQKVEADASEPTSESVFATNWLELQGREQNESRATVMAGTEDVTRLHDISSIESFIQPRNTGPEHWDFQPIWPQWLFFLAMPLWFIDLALRRVHAAFRPRHRP